jgi:murein DD-endopeptidase MepM/ murein hydrolase activator NlpD
MRISSIFGFVAAFFISTPAWANISCDDYQGKVCLEAVQTDSGVTFFVENRYPLLAVTLKLSVELENLRRLSGNDGPFVLQGGTRTELAGFGSVKAAPWSYRYQFDWNRGDHRSVPDVNYHYRLPYAAGATFPVTQSCYGSFTHHGSARFAIDFLMPVNTPIHAAREGQIVDLKEDSSTGGATGNYRNDGNYIVVKHEDGTLAQYFHLRQGGAEVTLGQTVKRGELIGYSGNTGQSTAPHLHFDVVKGGKGRESETLPLSFETASGTASCPPVPSAFTAVNR